MTHDDPHDRVEDVQTTVEAAAKLAAQPETFLAALDAFRAQDAERFQSELQRAGVLEHCRRICHWFCSKHCVFVCHKLAGRAPEVQEFDPKEVLEFTLAVRALAEDKDLVAALVAAVDKVDTKAFQDLAKRAKIDQRYWHQLCHWLCAVKCRLVCRRLCPDLPTITKVGLIPATHISAAGYGSGPSVPAGPTPPDSFSPGPYGHHPFGGYTHIEGSIFGIANVEAYKVEYALDPVAGPWTPMLNPVDDFDLSTLTDYQRTPDGAGWFLVSEMGLYKTSLANWSTPAPDGKYFLKLTVRNTTSAEFASGLVPALVDNTPPSSFNLEITQKGEKLPCCAEVVKENGPLTITVTGEDANFEALSIALRGGCNVSYPVFSKTYDGDVTDTGAPPPGITFNYDPWAAGVEPCCYVLEVVVSDRAIVTNTLWAHHVVSSVHSITIG
jgi:hypothetical protein